MGVAIDLPASKDGIHRAIGAGHELLTTAEGQFVHLAQHEDVLAIEVVWPETVFGINGIVTPVMIETLGPGVMGQQGQAMTEALIELSLQGVVAAGGAIAEEVEILGIGSKQPSGIRIQPTFPSESHDSEIVGVEGGVILHEAVSALVADVAHLKGHGLGELALYGHVVSIQGRQTHLKRAGTGKDPLGQRQQAVARYGRECLGRWPLCQGKDCGLARSAVECAARGSVILRC